VRDTRESRLLLVLLVAIAFALITVDIRGGDASPLNGARDGAASVLGPAERGVAGVVDPIGNTIRAIRDSGGHNARIQALERQNADLRQRLASSDLAQSRNTEVKQLLGSAGAGQYTIKAAQVVAIGAAQGFSWTVTLDVGSADGIQRDETVISGAGLVGRVTTVAPDTSTVLLASDPEFTVGTRLEGGNEIGFATGQGDGPMKVELLNGQAKVKKGQRLVTFGSQGDKPFVPGVPVGTVTKVNDTPGSLTRTVLVKPFVDFTALDLVGVVVQPPRTDPRDAVLPTKPSPTPRALPSAPPSAKPSAKPGTTAGANAGATPSGQPSASSSPTPTGSPTTTPTP
jgi:rod shape-determining protein MreC